MKNPKKMILHCPLKKDQGAFVRSECPAIDNVRNIRKRLNALERTGAAKPEQLDSLRTSLRKAKTDETKGKFCASCVHKN
jgi:hypothetical protein